MALVFNEVFEHFLVNSSMLGLGISLALYSLIIPQIKKIFEKQAEKLKVANKKLKEISTDYGTLLLKGKIDDRLQEKLNKAKEEVIKYKQIKFHYGTGFLITGILFALATIFPIMNITGLESPIVLNFTLVSPFFLVWGIIILIYVWIMVFFDIKELLKTILNEAITESEKTIQESKKVEKQKRKK